jgi:two-component system phosphate regulon response regulator PhoB
MGGETILAVEDEDDIAELIRYNLEREGFRVVTTSTGEAGLQEAARRTPDLVLLDLMLPGVDGLEVCRRLKGDTRTAKIPIMMVTARGEEADIVAGLELGADDYVVKPFSPRVLLARTRSILRRRRDVPVEDEASPFSLQGIEIDPRRHEIHVDGKLLELTATEFKMLQFLARRPGWVFTRYQIVDGIRGPNYPVTERSVDVQIVALRKKLGERGKLIETIRGVGYRFKD